MDIHSEAYREEAQELLAELESCLLELENLPEDRDLIDRAFRALHTIKGSGAMFGFDDIAGFTHEVETVYDKVREGKLFVTKELISLSLQSCDFIKLLLNTSYENNEEDELKAVKIVNQLRELVIENVEIEVHEEEVIPVEAKSEENEAIYKINFNPFQNIFLTGTNPLTLIDELKDLGSTRIFGEINESIISNDFDAEKCYTGWVVYLKTGKGINAIKDVFIFVEDDAELNVEELISSSENVDEMQIDLVFEKINDPSVTDIENVEEIISNANSETAEPELSDDELIARLTEAENIKEKAKKEKSRVTKNNVSNIRVSSDKLDRLVDLVGELVTVQSRLSQTADKYSLPDLTLIAEEVERLSADLRDNAMSIRMMPIGSTFGNFTRLVRDLSNELGKMIELQTEGAETELDKTVIERLNDPIVHLIRNCVDHGIEMPEVRRKAGKQSKGIIKLSAAHSGGDVIIKVEDDGAGLDAEKIKAKAIEKGMLNKDSEISDQEAFALIMKPGFSTAANITNISGRGVGTDVVTKAIENLRGSLDIRSEKGKGTIISLRIPLTLAIIEGLLVKIGEWYYIFPLSSVKECIELTADDIKRSNGRKTVDVRGKLVPYINIREVFSVNGGVPKIQQVVIAKVDGQKMGFVVDEVVGEHQTVIKSLSKVYSSVKEISGATILGDGTLALILDLAKLIDTVEAEILTN